MGNHRPGISLCLTSDNLLYRGTTEKILQRYAVKITVNTLRQVAPEFVRQAGFAFTTLLIATTGCINLLINRRNDIGDGDVTGGPGQAVATIGAPDTAHQLVLAQARKKLFKINLIKSKNPSRKRLFLIIRLLNWVTDCAKD